MRRRLSTTSKALTASVVMIHKLPHQLSLQKKDAIRAAGAFGERSEPIFCPRAGATGTVDWASEASLEIILQSPQKKFVHPFQKMASSFIAGDYNLRRRPTNGNFFLLWNGPHTRTLIVSARSDSAVMIRKSTNRLSLQKNLNGEI